ncbi:MAG: hypothetical protein ABSB59_29720 [Streptosporangiaceae bacterium]|jgi:3-phenylpropionate/trans-cinnamate dioxygenase ferredoxin reductase subunit
MPSYVIAGGGLAAAKAAETLRDEGFDGEIVLLGSEPRASVYVHPADWYAEHRVDLREGVTVTAATPPPESSSPSGSQPAPS